MSKVGRPPGTHCKYGHEYTPENLLITKNGKHKGERRCRICIANNKARARERAQAKAKLRKESWFF